MRYLLNVQHVTVLRWCASVGHTMSFDSKSTWTPSADCSSLLEMYGYQVAELLSNVCIIYSNRPFLPIFSTKPFFFSVRSRRKENGSRFMFFFLSFFNLFSLTKWILGILVVVFFFHFLWAQLHLWNFIWHFAMEIISKWVFFFFFYYENVW